MNSLPQTASPRLPRLPLPDHPRYDQLLGLRDAMETRSFVPDEYVFNQGDAADGFYILTEGAAQVVKTEEGVEAEIMSLTAPSYLGERALLYSEPRAAGRVMGGSNPHQRFK